MKQALICLLAALPLLGEVKFDRKTDQIDVMIGGKPFTTFYFGTKYLKPYLHPLRAADGTIVTRMWPMETVAGETNDHPHHTGVWFTHDDVNGVQFWDDSKQGPNTGTIKLVKIDKVKGGAKQGTIDATFSWVDPKGKAVLTEHRHMVFYDDPKNRIMDFDVALTPVGGPVKFGDTKEGTFGIRLSDQMREKGGKGLMTNAQGKSGMKDVWGKPSEWVDYSGTVDGKELGVAIFDHPGNPKHPTFWHARDYGLFAANPFGERDFFRDKSRDGSVTFPAGKATSFRYRVIIHPGATATAGLADLYSKYK